MINLTGILSALADEGICGEPRAYSGRSMFGRTCVGVELDARAGHTNLCHLGAAIMCFGFVDGLDEDPDELIKVLSTTTTDELGRGLIVYWPDEPYEE